MKSKSRWFRLYAEIFRDPKISRLDDRLFRFWIGCLCLASENDGYLPDLEEISFHLRFKLSTTRECHEELFTLSLIEADGEGRFRPHNWNGRQYISDVSTDRVKRFRERSRNVTETPSDTDTDTDTDTEEEKSAAAPPVSKILPLPVRRALPPPSKLNGQGPEWAARLYARHPKKKDEALVPGAIFAVMESAPSPAALFAEIDRVHALWCATFDWQEKNGRFAPVLASWILDHGWTVEPKPEISKEDYDLAEYDRANGKI